MKFLDASLLPIWKKVEKEARLDFEDGLTLYRTTDLAGLGAMAHWVRQRRHGNRAYYVYNQHVNYTNVCTNRCAFCAFAKDEGDKGAYTWSLEQVRRRLEERIHEPVHEIHMVGGLNEALGFDYFVSLLKTLKEVRPGATIKAFTAVEIDYLSKLSGLSLGETVATLKEAGLAMMPGGGAEVMSERVHKALFPKKIGKARWLEVMKAVHGEGIPTNATMLYGHIETLEERVAHILSLRELQDETGGFSAFIPLAFHSRNTELAHLPPTGGVDDLKNVAVARLLLDNFDHIKAYWVMIGEKMAQVALSFGADDLDGTILEEKITHTAGATSKKGLTRDEMVALVADAGFCPVERDSFYKEVKSA